VAASAEDGSFSAKGHDRLPPVVYTIERLVTVRPLVKYCYSFFFRAKKDLCNSCGICVKNCPVGNITFDKNGRPKWGRDCIACFYCEMKCPVDAVRSPVSWPVMYPFYYYNIGKALKNPVLTMKKVIHGKGKTTPAVE